MRAIKLSASVIAVLVMGSTPVSSLDVPSSVMPHDLLSCTASGKSMITLVDARGAASIALISSVRCDN